MWHGCEGGSAPGLPGCGNFCVGMLPWRGKHSRGFLGYQIYAKALVMKLVIALEFNPDLVPSVRRQLLLPEAQGHRCEQSHPSRQEGQALLPLVEALAL